MKEAIKIMLGILAFIGLTGTSIYPILLENGWIVFGASVFALWRLSKK